MKRFTLAGIGAAAIAVTLLSGCGSDATTTQTSPPSSTQKKAAEKKPSPTPTKKLSCWVNLKEGEPIPEGQGHCEIHREPASPKPKPKPKPKKTKAQIWSPVVDVVDGDTIKVDWKGRTETVRLIGIDTPETVHPTKGIECYGPEASRQAHKFLDGVEVRLELDPSQGQRDKYDRLLAYVWMRDGRLFNEVMIQGGYAEEYLYDTPYEYRDRFVAAEKRAKAENAGLWGQCSKPKPEPKPQPETRTDPRFGTCKEAIAAGYGPYVEGRDPEYDWYRDADGDGIVCES